MELSNLKSRPAEWLRGGPQSDVVVSSRARLARNVRGYHFVNRASRAQTAELEGLLRRELLSDRMDPALTYVELHNLDHLLLDLLLERRLVSHQHVEADWVRGVAFDDEERLSVMVNEEDHLRMQFMLGGLRLREAYERVREFDDSLADRLPFDFSPAYGYLTACPTNTGTGLRASVMLHLPGLIMSREMQQVVSLVEEEELTIRGVYGEGTHGAGDLYQVSNRITLGLGEEEIVESVRKAALRLAEMERSARRGLRDARPEEFGNRIKRVLELLRTAETISSQETLSFLSQIRLGVEMEVLPAETRETLQELFLLTLPAHLQTMEGRELDTAVRNELRAVYVRNKLADS